MLTFDAETHTYRLGGEVIPSVTQVLESIYADAYSGIPAAIIDRKSEIGRVVHAASELIDQDDLDDESVDPAIAGYLDAYRDFLRAVEPVWTHSERQLAHPTWRFAGTLDRCGLIDGHLSIVDLKTTVNLHPAVGLQLAGYDVLHQHNDPSAGELAKRYALQLKPDGTWKLVPFAESDDYRVFQSLLTVHHWRAKHAA